MERYLRELQSPARTKQRHRRFAEALVAAFAVLIGIAVYGAVQNQRAAEARGFVARSLAIQDAILQLENWSAKMEVRQRGFLITGDDASVRLREEAYRAGLETGRSLLALVAGNASQVRLGHQVIAALRDRHARMAGVERIARRQGLDAARDAFRLRGSVDPVLDGLTAMRAAQAGTLSRVTERADRAAARFAAIVLVGTGAALLVVVLTSVLMLRQLSRNTRLGRELLRMHQAQEHKARELERSNRELEAFTYTISHDLRAPLRHVDGYARMLQEDAAQLLTGDMRRYLDTISDSSRRMGALIDDLLAFSRFGRKPIERVRLDMDDLVRRVLPEAGAGTGGATIDIAALPPVDADPVLMRQAWVNLVSNALKYSAPKGDAARIHISGEREGQVVRYRIRDNGVGFDMRYADKLFGVFQRMHSQDEFEGTGVGLAIVQQVVQRHGGRVCAEAEPGQGACFTLEFPAEAA